MPADHAGITVRQKLHQYHRRTLGAEIVSSDGDVQLT